MVVVTRVMFRASLHIGLAFLLVGCSGFETESDGVDRDAGSGTDDAGQVDFCPDPENPRVHYEERNPAECAKLALDCDDSQNGFDNACGCGCIDKGDPLCPPIEDDSITWLSRDPDACPEVAPACPLGSIGFTNSCGCGCIER